MTTTKYNVSAKITEEMLDLIADWQSDNNICGHIDTIDYAIEYVAKSSIEYAIGGEHIRILQLIADLTSLRKELLMFQRSTMKEEVNIETYKEQSHDEE